MHSSTCTGTESEQLGVEQLKCYQTSCYMRGTVPVVCMLKRRALSSEIPPTIPETEGRCEEQVS